MLKVYTDGACDPNPGQGSWAYVCLLFGDNVEEDSGAVAETTNNRMEQTAILRALKAAGEYGQDVVIHSDSQYCIKGMTVWRKSWSQKPNKKVANKDLWNKLWQAEADLRSDGLSVVYKFVRGHSGDYWNEYVDEMCSVALRRSCEEDMQESDYLDFRFALAVSK